MLKPIIYVPGAVWLSKRNIYSSDTHVSCFQKYVMIFFSNFQNKKLTVNVVVNTYSCSSPYYNSITQISESDNFIALGLAQISWSYESPIIWQSKSNSNQGLKWPKDLK